MEKNEDRPLVSKGRFFDYFPDVKSLLMAENQRI